MSSQRIRSDLRKNWVGWPNKRCDVKRGRQSPEHQLQVALFDYLAIALRPDLEARAIPNGEKRHISVASRLKAEGVKRGTPDIFICLPEGRVAWLEMKAAKGSLSADQKAFRDRVEALGHHWACAKSIEEALEFLASIDALKPAFRSNEAFLEAAKYHTNLMRIVK